jgi:hypothetical protein
VYETLNKLKSVWDEYACVGYTNDETLVDLHKNLHLQYIENASKYDSFHVYYFNSTIYRKDLNHLRTEFKRLHFPYDPAVYSNGQKVFRHPLTVKRLYEFGESIPTSVVCPAHLKPSQLLIQPDDNEEYEAKFIQFARIIGVDRKITPSSNVQQICSATVDISDVTFDGIIKQIAEFNDKSNIKYNEWLSLMGCISCYPLDEELKITSINNHHLFYYSPNDHEITDADYPKNYQTLSLRNNSSISTVNAIRKWMRNNLVLE